MYTTVVFCSSTQITLFVQFSMLYIQCIIIIQTVCRMRGEVENEGSGRGRDNEREGEERKGEETEEQREEGGERVR